MHTHKAGWYSIYLLGRKGREEDILLVKSSKVVMIYYMTVWSKKQVTIIYLKYLLSSNEFLILSEMA